MAKKTRKPTRKPSTRPTGTFFLVHFTERGEALWTGRGWTGEEKHARTFESKGAAFSYAEKSLEKFPETHVVEKFGKYFEDLTHGQVGVSQAA